MLLQSLNEFTNAIGKNQELLIVVSRDCYQSRAAAYRENEVFSPVKLYLFDHSCRFIISGFMYFFRQRSIHRIKLN